MNHKTCRRHECKKYQECNFSIWEFNEKPEGCEGYMSRTMRIYKDYEEKCKSNGFEPLPYNIYFEF